MTRDVYAGDQDLDGGSAAPQAPTQTRIAIRADADADVLLRIAATLNTLNRAPQDVHMQCDPEGAAQVEVLILDCDEDVSDRLCRKLRQLTCVISAERVLMRSKP